MDGQAQLDVGGEVANNLRTKCVAKSPRRSAFQQSCGSLIVHAVGLS